MHRQWGEKDMLYYCPVNKIVWQYDHKGNVHKYDNLLRNNDFFSQVIYKTCGGKLPFIFQPQVDNNNPDQFAICQLDMDSFNITQIANKAYNCKLKIREIW